MVTFNIETFVDEDNKQFFNRLVSRISSGGIATKVELAALHEIVSLVSVDIESDSTRLGYLVPLGLLSVWLNDDSLADSEGRDDQASENIGDHDRLQYARNMLGNIGDLLDGDMHPGLLTFGLSVGEMYLTVGYAISGYSFSGIEVSCIECGIDRADLITRLSRKYLLIDDAFFFSETKDTAIAEVSDEFILKHWDPR